MLNLMNNNVQTICSVEAESNLDIVISKKELEQLKKEVRLYTDIGGVSKITPPTDKIIQERTRQIEKWGLQTHTLPGWGNILAEEAGEVQQAICDYSVVGGGAKEKIMDELIQIMAVATNIYRILDDQD